jgi:hypothetical protein
VPRERMFVVEPKTAGAAAVGVEFSLK